MEKIILQTTRETLMKFSKKHLVSTAFILVLLLSISFPLYAEEAELTLEALAEKIEELFAGQDDLASTVEELAERVEELETRVAPTATPTKTAAPIITPTTTPTHTVTPTPIPTADPDSVIVVQIARGNVRSGPGTQYDIVAVVESGDILQGPIQETSGWYQFCCVNEEETGWISSTLVTVQSREELSEWEAARSAAVEIDNEDLLRNIETHVGKLIYFKADVIQALEDRVLVIVEEGEGVQGVIWLIYENSSPRLIAEDNIEFVAEVIDLYTYETSGRGALTVPLLSVVEVRLIEE